MPFTNYAIAQMLTYTFGDVSFNPPADFYLALSSTAPTQNQGAGAPYWNFTEPNSGGNYFRGGVSYNSSTNTITPIANNSTNFVAIPSEGQSGYQLQNATTWLFPTSNGPWSTGSTPLIYGGLFDAATGGNLWAYGPVNPTITVTNSNQIVKFPEGEIILGLF